MTDTATFEARARDAFRTAWCEVKSKLPRLPEGVDEECLLERMTHELVGLVERHSAERVCELRATIQRMVNDLQFIDENGDPVIDGEQHDTMLERQVDVAVDVLSKLRSELPGRGEAATECESCQFIG